MSGRCVHGDRERAKRRRDHEVGDRWKSDDKPPVRLVHKPCDHDADPRFVCGHCGEDLAARDVRAEPGPGLSSVAA